MSRHALVLASLVGVAMPATANAQNMQIDWATHAHSTHAPGTFLVPGFGSYFCTDAFPDGSTVVVGTHLFTAQTDTAVFDPGGPNETILARAGSQVNYEEFIAKYAADGSLLWAVLSSDGAKPFTCSAVADGTVLVAGNVDTAAGRFGPGQPNETVLPYGNYLARYAANGQLLWAKGLPRGPSTTAGPRMGGFPDGSSVMSIQDQSNPAAPVTLQRRDANGDQVWTKSILVSGGATAGLGGLRVDGVETFSDGSFGLLAVLASGSTPSTATFGPGEANQIVVPAPAASSLGTSRKARFAGFERV